MPGLRTSAPIVGPALERRLREFDRPIPVAAPLLAHEALKCARRIGFRLFGREPDLKATREERARYEDGDFVDAVAAEVLVLEKGCRIQVPFNWLPEYPLKGKADAATSKVVAEVKSQNEKGYSRAVGAWDGVPAAPKPEWLIQAGLAACSPSIGASSVHIVLVDNDRFEVAEWLVPVDRPLDLPELPPAEVNVETGEMVLPTVRTLVVAELDRQAGVLGLCEEGTLPGRDVPGFGRVVDPPGRDEYGDPWQCRFCPWQPSCKGLPAAEVADFGEMAA